MVAYATDLGIGIAADSTVYIAAARQWLHPWGIAPLVGSGEGIVPTSIVPGYPAALAAASVILQMDPIEAARWLHVVILPLNVLLMGLLLRRVLPDARWTPWLGALALLARDVLTLHTMAYTEPLFLTFVLAALYALDRWLIGGRVAWLATTTLAVTAACLTRFAGVALAGSCMLAIVCFAAAPQMRRVMYAAVFGVIVLLPMLAWSAVTPGFRSLVYHPPPPEWLVGGLHTIAGWIALDVVLGPGELRAWAGAAVFAVVIALAAVQWQRSQPAATRLPECAALFAVCYVLVLAVTQFVWDADTGLDGRRLAPLFTAVVLLVPPGLHLVGRRARWLPAPVRIVTVSVAGVGLAMVSAFMVSASREWLRNAHADGIEYAGRRWQQSALLQAVTALPQGTFVVSNANDLVATFAGQPSARVPSRINPSTLRDAPDYSRRMAALREELGRRGGVVAYFRPMTRQRWYLPTAADLEIEWGLEPLHEYDDGVLYRLSSSSQAPPP